MDYLRRRLGNVVVACALLVACAPSVDSTEDPDDSGGAPGGAAGRAGRPTAGTSGAAGAAGTPGVPGTGGIPGAAPAAPYVPPRVVISEIMYHPVQENAAEESHEFVELHNRTAAAVAIGSWRFAAGVMFTFPAGAMIPPSGHLIVAKAPDKVAALYKLDRAQVHGPFTGALDNGGGRLLLQDDKGVTIDDLVYDDRAPWPMGADAMGVGPDFLVAAGLPISTKQYIGRSLERLSAEVSGGDPGNWIASPVDQPSPGRGNSVTGAPQVVAATLEAHPEADAARVGKVFATDKVMVRVKMVGKVASATLEHFVDDPEVTDEKAERLPMKLAGERWEAVLPARPVNAIVRYRVLASSDGKEQLVTPRDGDPMRFHAYFVDPQLASKSSVYHVFLSKAGWAKMYDNIKDGRPLNCADDKKRWNARVPAVLAHDGVVYDILTRYQGSKFNRGNGEAIAPTGAGLEIWPMEARPAAMNYGGWGGMGSAPFRALSLRFYMPRYRALEGKSDIIMNKVTQACQAFSTWVGGRIMEQIGVASSRVWYRRIYINGRYYHYMAEYERPGEEMLKRVYGKAHQVGDMFKSIGNLADEGAYGWGDQRLLPPMGAYSTMQRMSCTYARKAPEWKDDAGMPAAEILSLSQEFEAARPNKMVNPAAMKAFFEKNFDVPALTSYVAALNWMFPWDDFFQNHFMYRRTDGKWMIFPWDFDLLMGGWTFPANTVSAQASFWVGEIGNRSNRDAWVNTLKDAYIKIYRDQLRDRIKQLAVAELASDKVAKLADEAFADYSLDDAKEQPARSTTNGMSRGATACGGPAALRDRIKKWAVDRNARVASGIFD